MLGIVVLVLLAMFLIIPIVVFMDEFDNWKFVLSFVSVILEAVVGIALIFVIVSATINHVGSVGKLGSMLETHDILEYQLENKVYESDNNIGLSELYEKINEYNTEVLQGRYMQDNIWFGCLFPDIYDDMELIDYR